MRYEIRDMRTWESRYDAIDYMIRRNRQTSNDPIVVVSGPCDDEWTTMPLSEAIENGFMYQWAV